MSQRLTRPTTETAGGPSDDCPDCGAATTNVQGIQACTDCGWTLVAED